MSCSPSLRPRSLARRRLLAAALCGGAALGGCGRRVQAVPDVDYTLLDGTRANTRQLRGRVLLVNFWATSCAVCVAEMPQLVDLHQRHRARGFHTLAVAMSWDAPARVAHFAEQRALPFGVVIDNTGAFARAWGDVKVTPTSFVLDRQGAVAMHWQGAPDMPRLQALIEQLLARA